MMNYKGYLGVARPDPDARVFRGSVVNIVDTITFQGGTYEELEREFRASVDDYLEFCESRGESPDKPFSGRLPLRVKPETHRALAIRAKARELSLNAYMNKILERLVSRPATKIATRHGTASLARKAIGKAVAERKALVLGKGSTYRAIGKTKAAKAGQVKGTK